MYGIILKPAAEKQLDRLSREVRRRIIKALERLQENPRPAGSAQLQGADDLWRIRVGDYRVIDTVQDDELLALVLRVAHRKDAYRGD